MNRCNREGGAMFNKSKRIDHRTVTLILGISLFLGVTFSDGAFANDRPPYKIGVGDVLSISVWEEPNLTKEAVFVRNDGKITFPLLDDITAENKSTMELKNIIEKGLSEFVSAPNVTVTLINQGSRKFYILGEVMKTGEYPLTKKLTAVQAFALAGGFTEWASKDEIILSRNTNGKKQTIIINYKNILKGDFSKDIYLKADDTIIVP